ncbi:hypothetical protein V1478_016185 [Vespula squamosa]|uniref:Uncharacterized protein n=1 Tax=Vespula squamosa TaxID=30214 RepID=A0ABD1ZZ38_VESSQ
MGRGFPRGMGAAKRVEKQKERKVAAEMGVNEPQLGFSYDPLKYLEEVVLGCGGVQPPGIGVVRDARWGLLAEERLIQVGNFRYKRLWEVKEVEKVEKEKEKEDEEEDEEGEEEKEEEMEEQEGAHRLRASIARLSDSR